MQLHVDRFNRRDWDGVRDLIRADARLNVFDKFAGKVADAPYFATYGPGRITLSAAEVRRLWCGCLIIHGTTANSRKSTNTTKIQNSTDRFLRSVIRLIRLREPRRVPMVLGLAVCGPPAMFEPTSAEDVT
jgi:hypothetical protein